MGLQRHDRLGQVEHDAEGTGRGLAAAHGADHAGRRGQLQVGTGSGVGEIDDEAIGIGEAERTERGLVLQLQLGAGASRTFAQRQVADFIGVSEIPAQRGQEREPQDELLDSDPLHTHEG
jgi:hypothetical protein